MALVGICFPTKKVFIWKTLALINQPSISIGVSTIVANYSDIPPPSLSWTQWEYEQHTNMKIEIFLFSYDLRYMRLYSS